MRGKPLALLCKRGHPLVEGNLYFARDGARRCKECKKMHSALWAKKTNYHRRRLAADPEGVRKARRDYARKWRQENLGYYQAYAWNWRTKNAEHYRAYQRSYYHQHRKKKRLEAAE